MPCLGDEVIVMRTGSGSSVASVCPFPMGRISKRGSTGSTGGGDCIRLHSCAKPRSFGLSTEMGATRRNESGLPSVYPDMTVNTATYSLGNDHEERRRLVSQAP